MFQYKISPGYSYKINGQPFVTWEELGPDGTSMKVRYKDETELHEITQSQDYYNDSDTNNKVHITLTSPYNCSFNTGSNITI